MWLVSRSGKPTPTIFCDSEWAKMLWSKRRIYSEEHISFPAPRDISRHFLSRKSFRRSMNMAKVPWRHWWEKEAAARRRKKKYLSPYSPGHVFLPLPFRRSQFPLLLLLRSGVLSVLSPVAPGRGKRRKRLSSARWRQVR